MARTAIPYPPSPRHLPEDLTAVGPEYKRQVVLLLCSLVVFVCLYLCLVIGSVALGVLSLLLPFPVNLVGLFFFTLLFLFLLKGFFRKRGKTEKSLMVEIDPADHPLLWGFIERLCDETGAPLPYRVFLSPDVNAAVFYNQSFWSLFLPTPKNLLIGLGLVNVLNLSEFKGVLAHEFGHFSQKSMKLNSYVYMASHIIAQMVNGQDWVDDLVLRLRDRRSVLAVIGWAAYAITWLFRQGLVGAFFVLRRLNTALSRQMEFHADLVAVSVVGSEAAVRGLARAGFANEALAQAAADLRMAADHDLYTCDLFYQQNHAAGYLRRVRNDPHLGEPPPVPDDPARRCRIFEPDDDSVSSVWDDHPSNYDRERNAKRTYVPCPLDERSPWVLFDDAESVRELVTWRFYRVVLGVRRDVELCEADEVQAFIDAEQAETTYDPRYHGLYDGRLIDPGNPDDLVARLRRQPWSAAGLAEAHAGLYGGELEAVMQEHAERRKEQARLREMLRNRKDLEEDAVQFRGRRYRLDALERILKKVERELDADREWMEELDSWVFLTHFQMAEELGKGVRAELMGRYEFHLAVQKMIRDLGKQQAEVAMAMDFLSRQKSRLDVRDFMAVRDILRRACDVLEKVLRKADRMPLPRLRHLREGAPLGHFLLDRTVVKNLRPTARSFSGKWLGKFLGQLGDVESRLRRIHFKSLGALLALQEQIARDWTEQLRSVPEVLAADEPAPMPRRTRPRVVDR